MIAKKFRAAFLLSSLVLLHSQQPVLAQNLPGTALDASAISTQINSLFTLAEQAYPSVFVGASGWRSYEGYTFKYFEGSGIYAGIKDGEVYLMGGPYGGSPVAQGNISNIISALQAYITNPNPTPTAPAAVADFSSFIAARTLNDLISYFSSITMEYSSSILTLTTTAQIKLELLGQENVGSTSTNHLRVTITGGTPSASQAYDMWVDSAGTIQRLMQGTFEFAQAQSQLIGTGLVSSFLLALVAGDTPTIKAAVANEIANPALSTKVTQRIVGATQVDTIAVSVASGGAEVTAYISDFGNFTMMSEFLSKTSTMSTSFEIIDMKLR
jgi:hypothetical protein